MIVFEVLFSSLFVTKAITYHTRNFADGQIVEEQKILNPFYWVFLSGKVQSDRIAIFVYT
jgi:hypothetical protein